VGKTQLVVAYAKRHRGDYSAVFWLNARDETTLKQGFATVAERILREHPSVVYVANAVQSGDLDEIVGAVRQWFNQPKNNRWLIIYDNYDNPALDRNRGSQSTKHQDPSDADGDAYGDANAISRSYDIRLFFPDTYHGAILITTRSAKVKIGRQVALGKLKDFKHSLEILANASNRQDLQIGM
jgi:hypothetical protein